MPDSAQETAPVPQRAEDNRRRNVRLRSKSRVVVIRDTDAMRNGIQGSLLDVSCEGLGFIIEEPLEVGEQIKIRVRNDIQRFEKEIRGIVRRVIDGQDGGFQIGVELRCRLTPLDVSMLRSGLIAAGGAGPVCV